MRKVLIIAEAGVNHNGDIETAKKLISAAADAKVDYVKFQTFIANKLVSDKAQLAGYQKNNIGASAKDSQLEMLKKLELSKKDHFLLLEYCKIKGVKFLSTAFDMVSLDLLNELGMKLYKIPSGEITNRPYLEQIARYADEIILSTGMSSLDEIKDAMEVLRNNCNSKITILHCNTQYPTPYADVNLKAMLSIKEEFNVDVGYSDHTLGIEVPIAAVALGASVIEKHFTLDKNMSGPDHAASLEPSELTAMVSAIRNIEQAIGVPKKIVSSSEEENRFIARKSIHLKKSKQAGDIIHASDLEMLRPGDGISPMAIHQIIGKKVTRNLDEGAKLTFTDIEGS